MRLIDADMLMKEFAKFVRASNNSDFARIPTWNDAVSLVESAPTIEPERKKGRWVRITQGAIPEKYMCPFCHRTIENDSVESLLSMRFPFCHCGADMREGEQNG